MALLNVKFNEETMYEQLRGALLPNEQIRAAIYASFQTMGFLNNSSMEAGFFALTDQDRLIGVRHSMLGSSSFSGYLGLLKKLKVKKGLFGSKLIEYDDGNLHLRIGASPKVGTGVHMPNQAENCKILLDVLESRQI